MNRFHTAALFGLALLLFALQAKPGMAASTGEVVGKYGFDWLKPATAHCAEITEAMAARFKSCAAADANSGGSFTGKKDYFRCPAGKGSEYMIYSTKARCSEELETMKANAD